MLLFFPRTNSANQEIKRSKCDTCMYICCLHVIIIVQVNMNLGFAYEGSAEYVRFPI